MIPAKETDHQGTGREKLTDQFQGRKVTQGILDAFMGGVQDAEDAIFQTIDLRLLDAAEGVQLDHLGDIVGEARQGRGDADYREAVRLRVRINRSQGRAEDVIQVANISTDGDFTYQEVYPAGWEVTAFDLAAPRVLQHALGQTKAAGTRGVFTSSNWPSGENFVFGSIYATVPGENGPGSIYDGSIVSKFTSAQDATP